MTPLKRSIFTISTLLNSLYSLVLGSVLGEESVIGIATLKGLIVVKREKAEEKRVSGFGR